MPKDYHQKASNRQIASDAQRELATYGKLRSYERAWDDNSTELLVDASNTVWHPDDWQTYLKARSFLRDKDYTLACEVLKPLANKGYAEAEFCLGGIYWHAFDDSVSAISLFESASGKGHAEAKYYLGSAYLDGEGVAQDKSKAFQLLNECIGKLQESKSRFLSGAHSCLGQCYLFGYGTPSDDVKAVSHLMRAASGGYPFAQYLLGQQLWLGKGISKNSSEAAIWFQKAVEHDFCEAKYKLGLLYFDGDGVEQDRDKAFRLFSKAFEQMNDTDCLLGDVQNIIAICYWNGHGVAVDKVKALELLHSAAEKDCEVAQYNLARRYFYGDAVETDFTKAYQLFLNASKWQDASASPSEWYLWWCLEKGLGTGKDVEKAIEWLVTGAKRGCALCQRTLGAKYMNGDGVEEDYRQGVELLRLSADQKDSYAQFNLGKAYANGQGVEKDIHEAIKWFSAAAENGNAEVLLMLGKAYEEGRLIPANETKAADFFERAAKVGQHGSSVNGFEA
jgi:TPR repeat protein